MKPTFSPRFSYAFLSIALAGGLLLSGCGGPALPLEVGVAPTVVDPAPSATLNAVTPLPATATPLPATPSAITPPPAFPTAEALPPTAETITARCPLLAGSVYTNTQYGYCFAYPEVFTVFGDNPAVPAVSGPALDDSGDPLHAFLIVSTRPVPEGSDLGALAGGFMGQSVFAALPTPIERSSTTLGGEPAEVLEGVPGRLSSRVVLALHKNRLYQLTFSPVDAEPAQPDLEALYSAVVPSFTFLETQAQPPAVEDSASFFEFGRQFTFTFDPALALLVEAGTVDAVQPGPEVMFSDAHPALVQFSFLGYNGGRPAQLPYPFQTPRLMVFPTQEFASFGADQPAGFPQQLEDLRAILETRPDLSERCTQDTLGGEPALPFLPWLNSAQVFCAQPQYIDFEGGTGIRYLTTYSQGPNPVLDPNIFYTFQGLSADGELYISAVFPVATGLFPLEVVQPVTDELPQVDYTDELAALNAQAGDLFQPSLAQLDALVSSLKVEK